MNTDKAYWSWNIPGNEFRVSPSFNVVIGISDSESKKSSPLTEAQENVIKQWIKEQIEQHPDHHFSCKTILQIAHQEKEIELEWIGEIVLHDEDKNALEVMGEVAHAKTSSGSVLSLSKKAEYFQRIMDHLPDSVFFKDREGRFLAINKACAQKFNLKNPAEAIGKTDFDFFDEVHANEAFRDEQQVIDSETPIIHKTEKEVFQEEDKDPQWTSTSKLPLYDDLGNIVGTFGITANITRQKMGELRLKESNAIASKLSEQIPGFFYLYHYVSEAVTAFPFASDGVKETFEIEPKEIENTSQPILDRIHEDDLERVVKSIRLAAKKLTVWESDFRVVLPEKGIRWLRGKAKTEAQPDGTVLAYGYITDITEKKETYRTNVRLKKQLQAIFDAVPNLIFVKDLEGRYLMVNKATADFFGYSIEYIIGKKDIDLGIKEERAKTFSEIDQKVIESGQPFFIPEEEIPGAEGKERWLQSIKVPFHQTQTDAPAVLTIVTDITQSKRRELELRGSLDIIGEQNKRLNNFAHIISHNLRSHAGTISMISFLLNEDSSEEETKENLELLTLASERLKQTIDDLNEIIDEQYNTDKVLRKVNLKEYVLNIKKLLTTSIKKYDVQLQIDVPEELTFEYIPAYLESIILNLLSNAIKYRHPDRRPTILIKAFRENKNIHLYVEDNGLGIDLDKHGNKLFGMYKTFHENENAKGIGLFITKNQVESMNGSIQVESEIGEGTSFHITF